MEFCAHTVKGLQRITSQIHTKFVGVSLSGLECFFLCSFLRRRRPTELHSMTLAFHYKDVGHFDEIVLLGSEDGHLCSCSCIMVWTDCIALGFSSRRYFLVHYAKNCPLHVHREGWTMSKHSCCCRSLHPSLFSHLWRELQVLHSRKYFCEAAVSLSAPLQAQDWHSWVSRSP